MLLSGNGLQMLKRIGGRGRSRACDDVSLLLQAEYDVQLMWLMSSNIIFYFLDYKTVKPYMGDISLWDS